LHNISANVYILFVIKTIHISILLILKHIDSPVCANVKNHFLFLKNMFKTQFPFSLNRLRNKESWVLYISMFVLGACGLAYEYTLSKIAGDILGDSVRQWAVIIGVMMFFMGIGADLQKHFSDKYLIDYFIFFEVLIGLAGAFGPIAYIYVYGHFPMQFVLVKYFFIILIGLVIGFEVPLITRINGQFIKELKLNLASVLKMDYIGSLAGALAWVFLLPLFFEQVQTAFVLGMLNIFVAGFTFLFFRKKVVKKTLLAAFILISFTGTIIGYANSTNWRIAAEQYLYRDRIVLSETTRYQHIVLTESRSGNISCYINGHLQFNSVDEYIYHENLVHPAFAIAPQKKNILILGGGDGLAVREVLKYPQAEHIVLCDIDPAMTRLARDNDIFKDVNSQSLSAAKVSVLKNNTLIPADSADVFMVNQNEFHGRRAAKTGRVEIINLDAVSFIEQISGIYDIIILDFPDPNSPDLAKLYSEQFYQHLKNKLAADGIIVQQSTSPFHAKEVFLSIGRTLNASGFNVIPYHDNVPSFGEWGWWIGGHAGSYSAATLRKRISSIEKLNVDTRYLTAKVLKAALIFGKDQLNSDEKEINSLANNQVYQYYLDSWQD
jgi:spermidine synthase